MSGLGTQDPWSFASDHGNDAVGDREVHRARAENVDQNSGEPPAFVPVRLRIEFSGRAGRRLHLPIAEDGLPVAIQAHRRDAEEVLDADGETHFLVVLHLAQAYEKIAVFIGMVQLERRKDVRLALDPQQGVLLALAERVGVLEFDHRRCIANCSDIPTPREQLVLEFVAGLAAAGALENADALRAECTERRHHRTDHAGMHPMCIARRVSGKSSATREIDLDSDSLPLHLIADPTDLIEHGPESGRQVLVVTADLGDRYWFCRTRRYESRTFRRPYCHCS